jgi:hypothetical protein
MKPKKLESKATNPEYMPTAAEKLAIEKLTARAKGAPPSFKVRDGNGFQKVSPDHPDESVGAILQMESLGIADIDFFLGLRGQLTNAACRGAKNDEEVLNFMWSVVRGIKPNDQIEAMLAAQMAAIHTTTMTFVRRLSNVEYIDQQDSAERALNKLARTFAMQMEALKRYRTGGEQKVTVQHVSVQEGGQAIVGNVTQAAAAKTAADTAPVSPPLIEHSKTAPMQVIGESTRTAAPVGRKARR